MKKYSIYTRKGSNMLYLNMVGKRFSTGIHDTPQGRRLVREQAEKAIREELETEGIIPKTVVTGIRDLAEKYFDYLESRDRANRTMQINRLAFKTIEYEQNYELNKKNMSAKIENMLQAKTTTNNTFNSKVKTIGTFLKWAYEYEHINELISVKRYYLDREQHEPVPYTESEIKQIMILAEAKSRELFLLLRFIASTGFRIQETLKLKFQDFNFKTKVIQIANKIQKGKLQVFPITTAVQEIYDELILQSKKRTKNKENLFSWGVTMRRTVSRWLDNLERECGTKIAGRAFHGFRRSFADNLFANNLSLDVVKELMRHSSINTTFGHYKSYQTQKNLDLLDTIQQKK